MCMCVSPSVELVPHKHVHVLRITNRVSCSWSVHCFELLTALSIGALGRALHWVEDSTGVSAGALFCVLQQFQHSTALGRALEHWVQQCSPSTEGNLLQFIVHFHGKAVIHPLT